ncbi:MAG TPA: tricarballylate utilization 4Fe-4S protein TcuB [Dehalococcoidia bacterium]|nr:tricarballylate utilization 4Fe-4S protein TcuB [Dehalococcoidia bacterium]
MPSADLIQEIDRQLTICNACRYCEGYCAVFPAMELRRTFDKEDILYMANLCFECRACYNACPYTPEHEYDINIPKVLSQLRVETYQEYATPRLLSKLLFNRAGAVLGLLLGSIGLIFALVWAFQGSDVLFESNTEEGAFFDVIPYLAITVPAMLLSGYWLAVLSIGGVRFWRDTKGRTGQMFSWAAFLKASKDAFGLEYMKGGGEGCDYPTAAKSRARFWSHHLLVWGIALNFVATSWAAILHNVLGSDGPYPYVSGPVISGVVGGVMILLGAVGLLWLKARSDKGPAEAKMLSMDVAFLALLLLASVTGLLLLALRESAAMGALLVIHLGVIAALYLTLPYGKFAHVVYRYAALVKYQIEMSRTAPRAAGH